MAVEIPPPGGFSFSDWATSTAYLSNVAGSVPLPPDERRWRDWGVSLMNSSAFRDAAVADPFQFVNWWDWAVALKRAFTQAQ